MTNLKHVLSENFFILSSVSGLHHLQKIELLWTAHSHEHSYFTKFRKIDETVPRYLICYIDNLLLHGIQTQHLHGGQQVL